MDSVLGLCSSQRMKHAVAHSTAHLNAEIVVVVTVSTVPHPTSWDIGLLEHFSGDHTALTKFSNVTASGTESALNCVQCVTQCASFLQQTAVHKLWVHKISHNLFTFCQSLRYSARETAVKPGVIRKALLAA